MSRYRALACIPLVLVLSTPAGSSEQGRPAWLGGGKSDQYRTFQGPKGKFALEVPKRGWQTVSGLGSVIVVFSQVKSEATVAVEHAGLNLALAPEEITQLFVDLEVTKIKERDAVPEGFRTALLTAPDGHRVIVIDFTRQGLRGAERVRQYSLPSGADIFRLICSTSPALFDRYSPVFEHMADSFKANLVAGPVK